MSTVIQRLSPNWNKRPCPVDAIVLHATASRHGKSDVEWCCNPRSKVSYHTIIDRDGVIYAMVDTDKRAWHAGGSMFHGRGDCNDYAIGLAFANDNIGEPYTDRQYEIGAVVVAGYMAKHRLITLDRITTHAHVAMPPGRKTDPFGFDVPRFLNLVSQATLATTLPR